MATTTTPSPPAEAKCCARPAFVNNNDTHRKCVRCGAEWTAAKAGEPWQRRAIVAEPAK